LMCLLLANHISVMDYCLVIAIARAVTVIESFVLRSLLKIEGA